MTRPAEPAGPWDRGLQPERTALAWRRTAFALCAGLVVAARAVSHQTPWFAIALPLAAVVLGILVVQAAHRRARRLDTHLRGDAAPPGGRLVLTACALTVALGLAAAWWVLHAADR